MTLSDEQKTLINETITHIHIINDLLDKLRQADIACNLVQDMNGKYWMLKMHAMIRSEHYK